MIAVLFLIALCCQIPSIKSSDVKIIKFDKLSPSAIRISVDSGRLPFNQITVNYQLTVSDTKDVCKTNTTEIKKFSDNYTNRCEKELYLFNYTASSSNESYSLAERYCGLKSITSLCSGIIVLPDLLPSSIYEIEITVSDVRENSGNRTVNSSVYRVCTYLDLPIWSAQADYGSFQIISRENATRKVALFWRNVPEFLHSREKLLYEGACKGSNGIIYLMGGTEYNYWVIDSPLIVNASFECQVRTRNSIGYSQTPTIIFIPEQRRVVQAPLRAKINIWERKANDKVELSWSKFDRIGNENSYYTLYLCTHEFKLNCGVMSGMISVDGTSTSVEISKSALREKILGLSYSVPDAKYSSGMVFPFHNSPSQRRALEEHYRLYRNEQAALDEVTRGCHETGLL